MSEIPAATRVGPVTLTVSDLERSIAFHTSVLGLRVHDRDGGGRALLGADIDLLELRENPDARPARGYCGLFHFALLLPRRTDLAAWLAHVAREGHTLTGLSDHSVSEAIYLDDPDGHGIEIYRDRPREEWEGRVASRMTTLPLDTGDLLATLEDPRTAPFDGLPDGTTMGHVHLCVAEVESTVSFYRDTLGFELMAQLGPQAAFLAAGGYHHHIGANTWQSAGAGFAPADAARLERATIVLPDAAARDRLADRLADAGAEPVTTDTGVRVADPSGNPLELRSAA